MYGFIGKLIAVTGQRDALVSVLVDGSAGIPGCLSCVVAHDPDDADGVWITEVWESAQRHSDALSLPSVKEVMARCAPLVANVAHGFKTVPVGGHGLG
jgi:quinol monooxygenase YgiN